MFTLLVSLRHIPAASAFASFSYLWLGRITFSGKQYWVHRELNAKHGPFVRIGPNEVLTDDAGVIKQISSTHSSYRRGSWYLTGRFNPYYDNLLSTLATPAHKELKTKLLTAIGPRENPKLEQAIDDQIKGLLRVIRTRYLAVSTEEKQPLLDLGPAQELLNLGCQWGSMEITADGDWDSVCLKVEQDVAGDTMALVIHL